jgi:hypothetical protein
MSPPEQPNTDRAKSKEKRKVLKVPLCQWKRIISDLRNRHKRPKLPSGVPSIRHSIPAIIKASRELPPRSFALALPTHRRSYLALNVLLIFIPLSVRVFNGDLAGSQV